MTRHSTQRRIALQARKDPARGWAEPAQAEDEEEGEEEFPWGGVEMGVHEFRVWGGVGGSHGVSVLG